MAPAAIPEPARRAAKSLTLAGVMTPPAAVQQQEIAGVALARKPIAEPARVVDDDRAHDGIGDRRGEALVLEDLGKHLRGDRDRDVRHLFEQDVAHGALVLAVEIGVHEADRDRGDAPARQDARDVARCRHVERLDHGAAGVDAFGYGQPIPPRHIRFDDILVGVPEVFLVGAPDLDDIAKALGRHHGGAGQAARDQRVGLRPWSRARTARPWKGQSRPWKRRP